MRSLGQRCEASDPTVNEVIMEPQREVFASPGNNVCISSDP